MRNLTSSCLGLWLGRLNEIKIDQRVRVPWLNPWVARRVGWGGGGDPKPFAMGKMVRSWRIELFTIL